MNNQQKTLTKGYVVNKKQSQRGNAHFILAIILVIVMFGALGYVFWSNNMQPKTATTTTSSSGTALTEVAYDKSTSSGLAVKYPKLWTIANTTATNKDDTTITSPDGKITVNFSVALVAGQGGVCMSSIDGSKPIQLAQLDSDVISGYSGARFVTYIDHNTINGEYVFSSGAQVVNVYNLAVKVGDTTDKCDSFGGIGVDREILINKTVGAESLNPVVSVMISSKDITSASTISDMNNVIKTDDFNTAKRIVQSLYVK